MEPKITPEDTMSYYSSIFGSRRKVLDEWCKSDMNDKHLSNAWVVKTNVLNMLFSERRQTKDMNLVDAWA